MAQTPRRTVDAALRMPEHKGRWRQARGGALDEGPPQRTHLSQRVPPHLTSSASTAVALGSSICWGSSHGSGAAGPERGAPSRTPAPPTCLQLSTLISQSHPLSHDPLLNDLRLVLLLPLKARLWEALEVREKAEPKTLLAPAPLHRLPSLLPASLHSKPLRAHMALCVD